MGNGTDINRRERKERKGGGAVLLRFSFACRPSFANLRGMASEWWQTNGERDRHQPQRTQRAQRGWSCSSPVFIRVPPFVCQSEGNGKRMVADEWGTGPTSTAENARSAKGVELFFSGFHSPAVLRLPI